MREGQAHVQSEATGQDGDHTRVPIRRLTEPRPTHATAQGQAAALTMLARLLVPSMADWCILYLRNGEGRIERVVRVAADERLDRQLGEYTARYPLERLPNHPVLQAMATGESLLLPEVDEHWTADLGADAPHAADIEALQIASAIVVPLVSGDRVLGAVKVCRTRSSGKRLTRADVPVFEQIAQLAAYALENARLREEAERARAESARERARLEAVLDQMPSAVAISDEHGRLVYVNRGVWNLWFRVAAPSTMLVPSDEDLAAVQVRDPEGRPVPREDWPLMTAIRTRAPVEDMILHLVRTDGSSAWVRGNARPLVEDGRVVGAVAVMADITHEREHAAWLRRAREALEQNRRLGELTTLVSGVGHEVRTPLTYVGNHLVLALNALSRHDSAPLNAAQAHGVAEHLHAAVEGVDRVSALVADLRRLVRMEDPPREDVPLDEVVREAIDLFRATHPAGGRIEARLRPTPHVRIHRSKVHHLLLSLLENAADAVAAAKAEGARVRVETLAVPGGQGASVIVEDDGPGIAPDVRARMYQPLFSTKPHAAGLGLAVVRRVVEEHRGSIVCESQVGQGARFVVTLPPAG